MKARAQYCHDKPNFGGAYFLKESFTLALAVALNVIFAPRIRGENHVDYRYADYREDNDRMYIETHGLLFDTTLKEGLLAVKGELVRDAVSGATPSGAPPPAKWTFIPGIPPIGNPNSRAVPVTTLAPDLRYGGSLEVPITLGIHSIRPQGSYSSENDYWSTGAALNYAVALNEKNTTLTFGWAHTWDRVLDGQPTRHIQDKSGDDFLAGFNQLLGPQTVLGVNFTYGIAKGYLDDPYRLTFGVNDLQLDTGNPAGMGERRPDHREKFIARVSITQFITPVKASVEGAYRYYHDSFGIDAHTIELAWHQKIGKRVVISPNFRYYYQTAADFYYEILPGDPVTDPSSPLPRYFSPDYRLSKLQTISAGINATVNVTKWLALDATYKRYLMQSLDGVTSQSAYPSANAFTLGARFIF